MKKTLLILSVAVAATAQAQTAPASAWGRYGFAPVADRYVVFDFNAQGEQLPILWGFDTAWNDYGNMLRGVRHSGADAVGVARVSFQPWDIITEKGVLPEMLQRNLDSRLATVSLAGKKVDIALNLDGGAPTIKDVYGYLDENNNYIGDPDAVAAAYARLIDATAAAVQKAGYKVVSAAPFNEPDYFWNGTPIHVFDKINRLLKNQEEYPRFADIRISGGNTLNCDQALPWYTELKDYLDEGNTHQLAGDFDHYADFFATVRADGKYATADELHNVMEAMVGVEYGMQTGIWWGTAEQARGEFMKASFGERLAYAENRKAWSAASVYRAPSGKVMGFAGCSERQAMPSTYNYVSLSGDVFVNGMGPVREYVLSLPGDPKGEYQTELQRNAETMINICNGEDVQPDVRGDFALINAAAHKALGGKGGTTANGTDIVQQTYTAAAHQVWTVSPVPENNGGDFSYYFIRNTATGQALDDNNWNLEIGGKVIAYGPSGAGVQQWALEYDGDGWFHIRNKQSALYLDAQNTAEGTLIVQNERSDADTQRWRFLPADAPLEFDAPDAPAGLTTASYTASVHLSWQPVADATATYTVLRATDGSDAFVTVARGLQAPAFVDNSVATGVDYIYKVRAEDASGNRSLASAAVQAGPLGHGLVAQFAFDGNTDSEGSNMFAVKTVEDAQYRAGHKDGASALRLYTGQYGQLPYTALSGDEFSVAMWAMRTTTTANTRLFATGINENESLYLTPSADGSMRLVGVHEGSTAEIATDAMKRNEWVHIAVVKSAGAVSLYVNGEPVGESAGLAACMPQHTLLTYIGRGHESNPVYFAGAVEDLRVYNHAIDAAEVLAAMNGETNGIAEIGTDAIEIVATEYFNLQGMRIAAPEPGAVTIVRTTYSNGTVHTAKVRN